MLLLILQITVLAYILYQDYTQRQVYVILFPVLFLLNGVVTFLSQDTRNFIVFSIVNIVILCFQVAASWLWMRLRAGKRIRFFSDFFGMGDFLFFLCLAPLFSPLVFVLFFVSALVFSLLLWLLTKPFSKHKTVPLAGFMAIPLMVVLFLNHMGVLDVFMLGF